VVYIQIYLYFSMVYNQIHLLLVIKTTENNLAPHFTETEQRLLGRHKLTGQRLAIVKKYN